MAYASLPAPYGLHGWREPEAPPGATALVQSGGEAVSASPGPAVDGWLRAFHRAAACWNMQRNYASLVRADAGHPGLRALNGARRPKTLSWDSFCFLLVRFFVLLVPCCHCL